MKPTQQVVLRRLAHSLDSDVKSPHGQGKQVNKSKDEFFCAAVRS
ncbi:hypothetical protein BRCON_0025 [Candidatus Sumerlaea chitinivorans]|uniref:Uncharacterized protein n=1 Tax=Sumerlaea chitinivorans TaxID=2250252 RepID=A0A2Z4Y230_SUMC1|nr:hypothetical protein BRCON_0025 [Candidatus Sumerlaea chitinivorans]